MRNSFLLSFLLSAVVVGLHVPGFVALAEGQARGAKPAAAAPAGRSGIALTVTDMIGTTLPEIRVEMVGAARRSGTTNSGGQINFTGLAAGTYRLMFTGEKVITFEREVTLTAGRTTTLDISLNEAPPAPKPEPPPPPPPPPPAPEPVVGPRGMPQATSLYDLAEKELRAREPRREILVACSGNTRSTVVLLTTEDQPQRLYEDAEVAYYVLGGEATVTVDGTDHNLAAGGYVAVPRGVRFSITRRGRRPLSLLSVLSGAPCEEAR